MALTKTDWDIPVMIWWSVYWKLQTDIYPIELIEAWIEKRFKRMRQPLQWAKLLLSDACRPVEDNMSTGRPKFWIDRFDLGYAIDRSMIMSTGRPNPESIAERSRILPTVQPRPERIVDRSTPPRRPVETRWPSIPLYKAHILLCFSASKANRSICKAMFLSEPRTKTVLCKGF